MNIVALLTGRGGSTLKDKNVINILGKPLLYYPASAAIKSKYITHFYCSSDDSKILSAAKECNYIPIQRPEHLSLPTSQHEDVIKHAIQYIKDVYNINIDILVVLLANNAIVKTEWIDLSIENILSNDNISASCPVIEEMDNHPYRSKKLRNDGCLEPWFDFKDKNISTNRQDLPKNYLFCHNFWTLNVKKSIFSEDGQQPWTFMGNNIKPIIVKESFDIHSLEDVIKTEKWLNENL